MSPLDDLCVDLDAGTAPAFAWVQPGLCHSGHDCSLREADDWLASTVRSTLASPAWQDGGILIVTYDEGDSDAGCCGDAAGGRVPFVLVAPDGPAGTRSATPYSHYALLRSLEDLWGLGHLGHADDPDARPMRDVFPPGTLPS
jgi:hypothetical protein